MINLVFLIGILGFATFRLVRFLRWDVLFDPVRNVFWQIFPPKDLLLVKKPLGDSVPVVIDGRTEYMSVNGSFLGELTACFWCVSAYVSAAVTFVSQYGGSLLSVVGLSFFGWFLVWLAVWGLSCILLRNFAQ